MDRIVSYMAAHRGRWIIWMTLGTPLFLFGFLLDILVTLSRDFLANWKWEWRSDVAEWLRRFTEKGRAEALHPAFYAHQ